MVEILYEMNKTHDLGIWKVSASLTSTQKPFYSRLCFSDAKIMKYHS